MAFPVGAVPGAGVGCCFALLVFNFSAQVDVPYVKHTGINVSVHGPAGTLQIFPMCCVDMGE